MIRRGADGDDAMSCVRVDCPIFLLRRIGLPSMRI
jgi:hypothetical protein